MPGELAPKLALALACERGGEPAVAEGLYTTCASTDANYVAAGAFGLARLRGARGDVAGAVGALDLVPSTSRAFGDSRRLRAVALAGPAPTCRSSRRPSAASRASASTRTNAAC